MSTELPPPLENLCAYCKFYNDRFQDCRRHSPVVVGSGTGFPPMFPFETCGNFEHGPKWFEAMVKRPQVIFDETGNRTAVLAYERTLKDA